MRKILICCLVIIILILFAVLLFRILRDMFGTCENIREKMKGGNFVRCLGVGQPCRNIRFNENNKEFYMIPDQCYIRKTQDNKIIFFIICGNIYDKDKSENTGPTVLSDERDPVKAVFVISFNAKNYINLNGQIPDIPRRYGQREKRNLAEFMNKTETNKELLDQYAQQFGALFKEPTVDECRFIFENFEINSFNIIESYKAILKRIYIYLLSRVPPKHYIITPQQLTNENEYFRNFINTNTAFPILEKSSDNESVRDSYAFLNSENNFKEILFNNALGNKMPLKITIIPRQQNTSEYSFKNCTSTKTEKSIRNFWQKHIFYTKLNLIHKSAFYLSNKTGIIPFILWRQNLGFNADGSELHLADIFPNSLALYCLTSENCH